MPKRTFTTIDPNEAVAHVAYRTNEVIAIYPRAANPEELLPLLDACLRRG